MMDEGGGRGGTSGRGDGRGFRFSVSVPGRRWPHNETSTNIAFLGTLP